MNNFWYYGVRSRLIAASIPQMIQQINDEYKSGDLSRPPLVGMSKNSIW